MDFLWNLLWRPEVVIVPWTLMLLSPMFVLLALGRVIISLWEAKRRRATSPPQRLAPLP